MLTVIEGVLSGDEVAAFRERLDGGAWRDGAATAGGFARSQKRNQQLDDADPLTASLGAHILGKLGGHPLFISAALPKRIYPPRFNRYAGGGTYGAHVDSALMRPPGVDLTVRSDLSATLFLTEPDTYAGGELQIENPLGVQSVKLAAGDLILYPASSLHQVAPVTQGVRLASFFWIESFVRDDAARTTLFDLDQSIQALTAKLGQEDAHLRQLTGVYHNLLRRWALT
jgi:PKHD-type hydroxylase